MKGWIGIDLDGTLAEYEGWQGAHHVGAPVPRMLERVKSLLASGEDVRIFTARVGPQKDVNDTIRAREAIDAWALVHLGRTLPITATKDFACRAIYDDRAVQVLPNTGICISEVVESAAQALEALKSGDVQAAEARLEEFNAMLAICNR